MKYQTPAALALALTAVASIAFAQPETKLKVALTADIRSSNPGVNRDDNTDSVMLNVVEGLVGYDDGGDVRPLWPGKSPSRMTA